jgi:hypothetical protein
MVSNDGGRDSMKPTASITLALLLAFALPFGAAGAAQKGKLGIPAPVASEHAELHDTLVRAVGSGGKTGEAARRLADVLHEHFVKEESYALPLLGLLPALTGGGTIADAEAATKLAEKLEAELPRMLEEHKAILEALHGLSVAAEAEGKKEYVAFAAALEQHAKVEEEIYYPAALLVGEYLALKSKGR